VCNKIKNGHVGQEERINALQLEEVIYSGKVNAVDPSSALSASVTLDLS